MYHSLFFWYTSVFLSYSMHLNVCVVLESNRPPTGLTEEEAVRWTGVYVPLPGTSAMRMKSLLEFLISPVGKDSLPTTSRAPPIKRRSPPVQVGYSVARQLEGLTGVIVCGTMPCTAACGPVPFETRAGLDGLIDPTDGRTIFTGCSSLAIDETFLWSVGHDGEKF